MGALFGEFIRKLTGWQWRSVSNEYGQYLALVAFPGNGEAYIISPIDMIIKRIEKKEEWDLKDLLDYVFDTYEDEFGKLEFIK